MKKIMIYETNDKPMKYFVFIINESVRDEKILFDRFEKDYFGVTIFLGNNELKKFPIFSKKYNMILFLNAFKKRFKNRHKS